MGQFLLLSSQLGKLYLKNFKDIYNAILEIIYEESSRYQKNKK